jgi:hypothetical protein
MRRAVGLTGGGERAVQARPADEGVPPPDEWTRSPAEAVYRFDGRSFRIDVVRTTLPERPWGTSAAFRGRRYVVPIPGS